MENIAAELYSVAQVREIERRAIASGIPGYPLMQRAAGAAWAALRARWPEARRIVVCCGPGNNGGDGYELARLAQMAGCAVRVIEIDALPRRGEAASARAAWLAQGSVEAFSDHAIDADVIVDALFGIGFARAPEGAAAAAIDAINEAAARGVGVLAIDIPSGLNADTGAAPGRVVQAALTVSFIARKLGLHTGQGPACSGALVFAALDVPPCVADGVTPLATLTQAAALRRWLPRRGRSQHKGDHGHVLLIAGDHGMSGAALIAARAALRSGAGLVSVATRGEHAVQLAAAQPEAMFHGVESADELRPLIQRADVIAIGPGLGQHEWGRALCAAAFATSLPKVVDADALNLLAQNPQRRDDWVLTPHPGEAARLLGRRTAEVQADRAAAARELHARYGGVAVLKGAGTLVQGARLRVCPYGNPGMGSGGIGDALTGVIAAFLAQGPSLGLGLEDAAAAGVTAHALAGDHAAQGGERGLIPSDLIDALRAVVNPC